MMMRHDTFQHTLERVIGKKLKLRINNNHSTMLSVKWEPGCTTVSLHRFFLRAPKNVMDRLACYIRREEKQMSPEVTKFIENNIKKLDYSHKLDEEKLEVQGRNYNLQEMMAKINKKYFNNRLNLKITWFGQHKRKNRSRVTFGLYQDLLRLVKINRILDSPKFPEYVVSYVIYHEMLHHVCPSYTDENGRNKIHNKEFKVREKQFQDFERAQTWIENNINKFFIGIY